MAQHRCQQYCALARTLDIAGDRCTLLIVRELAPGPRRFTDLIDGARGREREIRVGAEDYADEILDTLEVNLSKFIAAIRRGRERLQGPDEPPTSGDTRDGPGR